VRRLILEFSNYVVRARALTKVFFSIKGCYLQAPPRAEIALEFVKWGVVGAPAYIQ